MASEAFKEGMKPQSSIMIGLKAARMIVEKERLRGRSAFHMSFWCAEG